MHPKILPLMLIICMKSDDCLPNDKGGLGHTLQGLLEWSYITREIQQGTYFMRVVLFLYDNGVQINPLLYKGWLPRPPNQTSGRTRLISEL